MADKEDVAATFGGLSPRVVKRNTDGSIEPARKVQNTDPDEELLAQMALDANIESLEEPEDEIDEEEDEGEEDDDFGEEEEIDFGANTGQPPRFVREETNKEKYRGTKKKTRRSRERYKARKAATMSRGKGNQVPYGIPDEEIKQLAASYDSVRVTLTRQNLTGQWAQMKGGSNVILPPMKVYDLPEVIERFAGGGTCVFEIKDPNDPSNRLVIFKLNLEGNPRPIPDDKTIAFIEAENAVKVVPRLEANQPAPVGPSPFGGFGFGSVQALSSGGAPVSLPNPQFDPRTGQLIPPPEALLPAYMRGYPAHAQWEFLHKDVQMKQPDGPGGGGWLLAQQRQADHESVLAERARLEERVNAVRKEFDLMLRERDKALDDAKERAAKAEAEIARTRSEAQIEGLKAQIAALSNKPSTWNPEMIAALAAPVASVVSAMFSGSTERVKASQSQTAELVKAAFSRKESGTGELVAALAPVAAPIIIKMLENRSPGAMAEAEMAKVDTTMASLKMVYDMIQAEAQSQPELPKWYPAVEGVMSMVLQTLQNKPRQLPHAPPQLPAQGQPRPETNAPQMAPTTAQMDPVELAFARYEKEDPEAARVTRLVWSQLPSGLGWHTPEWLSIIFHLHYRLDPADLSTMIADYLDHLQAFDMVPAVLLGAENEPTVFEAPKQYMENIIGSLPIGRQDPEYASLVVDRTAEEIALRARERQKVEEESEEEDAEEEEEAIASGGTAA